MPDINYPVANKTTVEGALAELAEKPLPNSDLIEPGTNNLYMTPAEKTAIANGTAINDGAITPAKTSFIGLYSSVIGKNKYNVNDSDIAVGKFSDSNGTIDGNASYKTSGFIAAVAGDVVRNYDFDASDVRSTLSNRTYALYNSAKEVIFVQTASSPYNITIAAEYTTCAFIRLSFLTTAYRPFVGVNFTPTVYEAYTLTHTYKLNDDILTEIPINKTLIANGDSITYGHQPAVDGYTDMTNAYGYIHMTAAKLGLTLKNYAISSSTLTDFDGTGQHEPLVNRYTAMDNDGDIIYIAIGSNDWFYGQCELGEITDRVETTFYGAMHLLCIGLKAKYPQKPIIFATPIKRYIVRDPQYISGHLNLRSEPITDICTAIKEVCEYHSIKVLDMYALSQLTPWEEADRTAYMPDGTHPNGAGHEQMSIVAAAYIKSILDVLA